MRDYCIYFPRPKTPPVWGVAVTGVGHAHTPAGSEYPIPTLKHPSDHMFRWEDGRVLEAWALLLIHEGEGYFESKATGRREVTNGSVFLLFPGVWHRYKPKPQIGYTESWIEFQGPVLDGLRGQGVLKPNKAVWRFGPQPAVDELFQNCHTLAQNRMSGYEGQLGASVLLLVATVIALGQMNQGPPTHMDEVVRHAQTVLMERCDQSVKVETLARELGVSPSHFRKAFTAHTGYSPRQYLGQLRLRRAEALLRNTSLSLKEIADQLGYGSPFHFSKEFKKQTGLAPDVWRRKRVRPA